MNLSSSASISPLAMQVADRWHLWHNLAQHVEKLVARHRGCLREPEPGPQPPSRPAVEPNLAIAQPTQDSILVKRTQQRYAAVQALRAEVVGQRSRQVSSDVVANIAR